MALQTILASEREPFRQNTAIRAIIEHIHSETIPVLTAGLSTNASKGKRAFVTDATSSVFNTAVASGGTANVPVFYDGTIWRVG